MNKRNAKIAELISRIVLWTQISDSADRGSDYVVARDAVKEIKQTLADDYDIVLDGVVKTKDRIAADALQSYEDELGIGNDGFLDHERDL
jgi:hypothetical protein